MFKLFLLVVLIGNFIENIYCNPETNTKTKKNDNESPEPILYPDAASIVKVLENPKNFKRKGVKQLLTSYQESLTKKNEFVANGVLKNHPLIVIEGLSGSGKTTISEELSKKINGTKVHSPLLDIKQLQHTFHKHPVIFNAYHQLSHYITANEIYPLLQNTTVILDRYYPSSMTYSIAKTMVEKNELPPKGSEVYNSPKDLLKPDIIIFLSVEEEERNRRLNSRTNKPKTRLGLNEVLLHNDPVYRKNVLLAYKYLTNPELVFVDANKPLNETLEEVYLQVKPLINIDN